MQAVFVGVRPVSCIERNARDKARSDEISQPLQARKLATRDASACLDLDADDATISCFGNQVDFVIITGSEMTKGQIEIAPTRLFEDLIDRKCLDEMTVFGERRRFCRCKSSLIDAKEGSSQATVNQMHLRHASHSGAERSAPRMEAMGQKHDVEQRAIVTSHTGVDTEIVGPKSRRP